MFLKVCWVHLLLKTNIFLLNIFHKDFFCCCCYVTYVLLRNTLTNHRKIYHLCAMGFSQLLQMKQVEIGVFFFSLDIVQLLKWLRALSLLTQTKQNSYLFFLNLIISKSSCVWLSQNQKKFSSLWNIFKREFYQTNEFTFC